MKRSNKAMVKMIHAKASQLTGPMKISTNARVEESSRSNIDIVINQSVDHQRKSFATNKYRTESQINSRKHSLKQVHEENSIEGGASSSRLKAQTPNIVIHP